MNFVDFEILFTLLSVHETMRVLRQVDMEQNQLLFAKMPPQQTVPELRRASREGIPKPELLFSEMPRHFRGENMRSVRSEFYNRETESNMEDSFGWKEKGEILRQNLCGAMVGLIIQLSPVCSLCIEEAL